MNLSEFRPQLWLTELLLDEFDVRGAVVIGEERVLVWDTLSHPRDMQPVAERTGGKPVFTVYSHADWDHCWGTAGLESAVVIAHAAAGERFKKGLVASKLAHMQTQSPGTYDGVRLVPPNLTFTNTLTIDLGGLEVELHPLPGHTEDCLVAFIPQLGVLLAGDTVETPLPYLNETSLASLPDWIAQLARWESDDRVQSVIPSHGVIGDRSLIGITLSYLRTLQAHNKPDVPAQLDAFYTATHAKNLALIGITT